MNLYKQLNLNPTRSEPDVWISRMVIFAQIAPNPIIIRDIPLTRGLNIIWATEFEDETKPTEITGHSAGKTTFSRLIRYILGEKTFGTKMSMELIQKTFPGGYVAAEIHVKGKKWAVRRPLGRGRLSCGIPNASIEDVATYQGRLMSHDTYIKEIGFENLLDEFETGGIIRTDEVIQWGHILSWCTRDQESRFQNLYDWRSPRSEADSPAFRFPKAGPLFVIRAALGLFLPEELKGEERLSELKKSKDLYLKELDEKQNEPQFRVNLYDYQLRNQIKVILPQEVDIDSRPFRSMDLIPEDLESITERITFENQSVIEKAQQDISLLQTQIDDLGAEIRQLKKELSNLDVLFNIDLSTINELNTDSVEREMQRKKIVEHIDSNCPFGDITLRECSYIKNRQQILNITQLQDRKLLEQIESLRNIECIKIKEQKEYIQKRIEDLLQEKGYASKKRDELYEKIRINEKIISNLSDTFNELEKWIDKRDKPGGYPEIDSLRQKLKNNEAEINKIENELNTLIQQHSNNRELLSIIFSAAVLSVITADQYNGEVHIDNREIIFRIIHGGSMSGEAVETLSVLLADITCLVYNSIMKDSHLPGFLLHDSPREADLGIRLYHSFIRLIANLQNHFNSIDECPFQYVITTTTPPPPELNNDLYVKLRLNAAITSELLLRKNITEPDEEKGLFN
jgi:hypothetical protein